MTGKKQKKLPTCQKHKNRAWFVKRGHSWKVPVWHQCYKYRWPQDPWDSEAGGCLRTQAHGYRFKQSHCPLIHPA